MAASSAGDERLVKPVAVDRLMAVLQQFLAQVGVPLGHPDARSAYAASKS